MVPDAHTNPVATTAAAAKNIAISSRVSVQSLRMVRLNVWTISEQDAFEQLTDFLRARLASSWATSRRQVGPAQQPPDLRGRPPAPRQDAACGRPFRVDLHWLFSDRQIQLRILGKSPRIHEGICEGDGHADFAPVLKSRRRVG